MHHDESVAADHRTFTGQAHPRPVIRLSPSSPPERDTPAIGGVPPMFATRQPPQSEGMPRRPASA